MSTKTQVRTSGTNKWNFLQRMKLWQKFALLGLVALSLLSYPMYQSVKANLDSIENVRTEQAGLPPIEIVQELLQAMQDHRTAGSYFVLNDATRAAPRAKAAASADELLARLEKLVTPTGDEVMTRRFSEVRQEWAVLKAEVDGRKLDSRAVIVKHTALIRKAMDMTADWTAYSLIDLDPDAAAYYSFRAALVDLPLLKESIRALRSPVTDRLDELAQARALAGQPGQAAIAEAAMRDALRPEDRARILDWIQDGESSARSFGDNMRKAVAASSMLKGEMAEQAAQVVQLTEQAMQYARREILSKEFPTVDPVAYNREVSVSRALAIKATESTQKQLADALTARGAKAQRGMWLTLGGSSVLLVIGLTIAIFTVRNITGTVFGLQRSVNKVREGDFAALQAIESQDEVGDLGRTVNDLLQERIAAQKKTEQEKVAAEAENEALNNSVISILQAVNQLSQRDLTAKAPVTQDIIGTVSDSINALTDETSRVLAGVNLIAGQVADASGKVKNQGALVSKTAEDERLSVARMIESLNESTQNTNQMAVLAEQSNLSAEQATQATDTALETVNGTVKGMESIRETIAETEKRIKRLGERSQEITGIVNLINTISERTHVLALNASMQAAVAGEAGRGFAVVAEEVQRLAESSRNATQQIGTLVNNIQLETNETIATVSRTIGQVVQGSEQAQKAGDQMRRTQQITAQLVAQVRRIAAASEQQKTMSGELLKSVQHIGASNDRTAQQIDAQNVETETLLDSAKRLVASVAVFKLPQAA